jgi:hypothetical protein
VATLDLADVSDTIVLYFGGEAARINAYTLAAAVSGVADAAKAANAIINPGYDIEVVVEALGSGSFRTLLRAISRERRNLFSAESARNIILGIVATVIYERVLSPKPDIVVNVEPAEVVIVSGHDRIIVPRQVYDAAKQVEASPTLRAGVNRTVTAISSDPNITSFGVAKSPRERPPLLLPRQDFLALPTAADPDEPATRILEEVTDVQILRAILERSRRKWEFVWNGSRISAPVLDESFYDDFFAHRITIAPGDSLRVRLRIRQNRLRDVGIFVTESYEVLEVIDHIPRRGDQTVLSLRPGA